MTSSWEKIVLLGFTVLSCFIFMGSDNPTKSGEGLSKTAIFEYKFLDINRINCTIASDGPFADYRRTGKAGLEWPRGSLRTLSFAAGVWIAGIHQPTGQIRSALQDYQSDFQPGPLLETFNTTTNNDAGPSARSTDRKYRLFKIQRNKPDGDEKNQIDKWSDWPGDLGAPYIDVNGNGQWDSGIDLPKFYGDQQMWCVTNDVNNSLHHSTSATMPMGIEVQTLYFAFDRLGALGDVMFMKYKIINKSDAQYDSVFVSLWSDIDLGNGNDDLPGCDTTRSLGYVYNQNENDGDVPGYGPSKPPACGFDFFEGPTIPGRVADSAIIDGAWYHGKKNLQASSFTVYCNGTFPQLRDPTLGSPTCALEAYDFMNGKAGTIHQYITDQSGKPIKFWFSGDPITGRGDLPSNFPLGTFVGQDIRIMISAGPFTLAKSDTQEVVGGFLVGRGDSRLNSIKVLKDHDDEAQQTFNDNFAVPGPAPLPPTRVSELSDKIVLDWSSNPNSTEHYTINHNKFHYAFQGYNLYQSLDPSNSESWKRIWTHDLIDTLGVIDDAVMDPVTGTNVLGHVIKGENNGLIHYFVIDRDYLGGGGPLINGKKYYFSLTTYSVYDSSWEYAFGNNIPIILENAKEPLTGEPTRNYVTTISPPVGTIIPTEVGNKLNHDRPNDDAVVIKVVDPLQLQEKNYQVSFNGSGLNVTGWNLVKNSADTLVCNSSDFSGDTSKNVHDGFDVVVKQPPVGVRQDDPAKNVHDGWTYQPADNQWFTGAGKNMDAMDNAGLVYPRAGNDYWSTANWIPVDKYCRGSSTPPDSLRRVEIRFGSTNTQMAYRFIAGLSTGVVLRPVDSAFMPYVKRRVKSQKGFQYQDRVSVPFTVWDVDPNYSGTPRPLNVAFVENNSFPEYSHLDGKWDPTIAENGGFEPIYIFNSTYDPTDSTHYVKSRVKPATDSLDLQIEQDSLDVLYIVHLKQKSADVSWHEGDVLTIQPNYPLRAGSRMYNFTPPAPTINNPNVAKTQLDKINVFPNPYFAHNRAESNMLNRYVTFTHLPPVATIKIFAINGELIRIILHQDGTSSAPRSFERWDLRNENGLPVASGIYITYIEIEGVGTKILKLAVIQPEERPTKI